MTSACGKGVKIASRGEGAGSSVCIYITFSHLADAFVQSDVQGREYSSYEQYMYATHYHAPPRDEVSSFSQTQIWSPYKVGRLLFYRRNMLIEVQLILYNYY